MPVGDTGVQLNLETDKPCTAIVNAAKSIESASRAIEDVASEKAHATAIKMTVANNVENIKKCLAIIDHAERSIRSSLNHPGSKTLSLGGLAGSDLK